MSSAPVGAGACVISASACARRLAIGHAPRADPDERELLDAAVAFENLVRDARQRAPDPIRVHDYRHGKPAPTAAKLWNEREDEREESS